MNFGLMSFLEDDPPPQIQDDPPLINTDDLLRETENQGTKKKAESNIKLIQNWLSKNIGENTAIDAMEPSVLDKALQSFFANIKRQDGTDYTIW